MKTVTTIALSFLLASLLGCGGGKSSFNQPAQQGGAPIDPSGNWSMTATDSNGGKVHFAAMFSQTGAVVTSNSFTAAGNSNFNCVPFTASLVNGLVQNVSNFTGVININLTAGAAFNTTLNDAGTSFSGTYSGMPACSGISASGTFSGDEVPTTSGTWTGSIQPCSFNEQDGSCPPTGTSSTMSAVLVQNDATGNVTGTYAVTNQSGFTTGTITVDSSNGDVLSGTVWQFSLTDANGTKYTCYGTLGLDKTFSGVAHYHGSTWVVALSH